MALYRTAFDPLTQHRHRVGPPRLSGLSAIVAPWAGTYNQSAYLFVTGPFDGYIQDRMKGTTWRVKADGKGWWVFENGAPLLGQVYDPVSGGPGKASAVTVQAAPAVVHQLPSGYVVISNFTPRSNAWPMYDKSPVEGATRTYQSTRDLGLDDIKLVSGKYGFLEKDLGAITLSNNRTYELLEDTFFDLETGQILGPFYVTIEGGGPGLLVSDPLLLASRVIAAVGTYGQSEVARAGAQEAGVSQKNIDLATEAFAAASLVVATVGAGYALMAPTAVGTAGAAAGTAEAAGAATAGTTAAAATTTGAATTVAATTTGTVAATATGGSLLTGAGAAVGTAALGVGTTAITTGLKKLIGPTAPEAPAEYSLVTPNEAPAPAPSKAGWLIPAAIAAFAMLAKRA